MKLVTVAEMQAIEREADGSGHTYADMMENAGRGLAEVLLDQYDMLAEEGAFALVGSGNNGGDALVALAYLGEQGWPIAAYIVLERPDDDPLVERFQKAGGKVFSAVGDKGNRQLASMMDEYGIMLDAVFGTGIRLPLRGKAAKTLDAARKLLAEMDAPPLVVAVDIPSGIDSDSGEAAPETIPADITVTMAALKAGMLKFPAFPMLGDLSLVGIGLPDEGEAIEAWKQVERTVPEPFEISRLLPGRPADAHKGTFGTALIVAGSLNYTGAVLLAGKAAYRIGAGLVTLAVPGSLHSALAGHIPEATWLLLPHEMGVIAAGAVSVLMENMERPTAMLLGPGFGVEDATEEFMARLLGARDAPGRRSIGFMASGSLKEKAEHGGLPPIVVDADGLKLLARIPDWHTRLPAPAILTPHPGEMSILTDLSVEDIQADRLGVAERFSKEWGHVVVLKGAFTVIASPDGRMAVIPVASPALARAGTGDVLAGAIVGLRAQGMDAYESSLAGAWIHAQAGLIASDLVGSTAAVLAGDLLDGMQEVLADLL